MLTKKTIRSSNIICFSNNEMPGGIHPRQYKDISNQNTTQHLTLAKNLILPINELDKNKLAHFVKRGQFLSFGQNIFSSEDILFDAVTHSPCEGEVIEVKNQDFDDPTGLPALSVKVRTTSDKKSPTFSLITDWIKATPHHLLNRIQEAAIVGLGGAAFPTHLKLNKQTLPMNTLIVNAMECEPYITCDDRLLREEASDILQGALITAKIINVSTILFGIEDNKPEAICALEKVILEYTKTLSENTNSSKIDIKIIITPTKYPSGGEKQLIQLLTGKQVPRGKYPTSLGILVQNVATLYAIYQAVVQGLPLTHRLVTITGELVKEPRNYWIAIGTPISHIISCLGINTSQLCDFIIGGPLMGQRYSNVEIPIKKSTNCIIFNANNDYFIPQNTDNNKSHVACIRCGECESACPVQLLPQQLYWYAQSEQWDSLQEHSLFDCIECGACNYVCPSKIPLVSYYRFAKSKIKSNQANQKQSETAKKRYENRIARLVRIEQQRDEKRKKIAETRKQASDNSNQDPDGKKSAIDAVLARVKSKKDYNN